MAKLHRLSHLLVIALLSATHAIAQGEDRPVVGTLHPLLTEMVHRLTGERVRVVELMGPGGNPHNFEPKASDLIRLQEAVIVLAMGKHLETYLDRLRTALPSAVQIYEAGRLVPSVRIDVSDEVFLCCPAHSHGAIDPHWWHDPMAVHRAARHLGRELENVFPQWKDEIRVNTRAFQTEMEGINQWARSEISRIPPSQRILVTPHAAFGYFCHAFGFRAVPVRGLTAEREPTASHLAETVAIIRREGIRAVFPETTASPAILDYLSESTGVKVGPSLYADNLGPERLTYREMFKHNVRVIVETLIPADAG